jgi:hypothetical protein
MTMGDRIKATATLTGAVLDEQPDAPVDAADESADVPGGSESALD